MNLKFLPLFATLLALTPVSQAEPMALKTPTGTLFGTLELPKGDTPHPVALILAGSGPTNRDGDTLQLGLKSGGLRLLAEELAARGIASVRADKRGVAESAPAAGQEADWHIDGYMDDAVLWGDKLKSDRRFSQLIIIGHSEGSLIGMVAARRLNASGFVSIAGPGRAANEVLLEQLEPRLPTELMKSSREIIASLLAGKTVDTVPGDLNSLFRPSVQPYLVSWFAYDPAKEIAKLPMPVLIEQGTTDLQVGAREASLLAKAQPAAKMNLVPGMNHVLKIANGSLEEQMPAYTYPTLPVAPQLVADISSFIQSLKKS
jgi:pimeloyl-ACP methyl ester carboxylesterase